MLFFQIPFEFDNWLVLIIINNKLLVTSAESLLVGQGVAAGFGVALVRQTVPGPIMQYHRIMNNQTTFKNKQV